MCRDTSIINVYSSDVYRAVHSCNIVVLMQAMSADVQVSQFSTNTLENARKAKVTLENFYENLLVQDRDRSNRFVQ